MLLHEKLCEALDMAFDAAACSSSELGVDFSTYIGSDPAWCKSSTERRSDSMKYSAGGFSFRYAAQTQSQLSSWAQHSAAVIDASGWSSRAIRIRQP